MPNNTTKAVLNINQGKNLKVYADEFIEKAALDIADTRLSKEELDWGAKCIDDMISGLYTAEELSKLKEAGIDPAMGILIDGKPADLYGTGNKFTSVVKVDNRAGKSKILANALQGKEIAVTKFGFDKDGNLKPQETVPVTTNLSKNIKEKSAKPGFFRRILEALGIMSSDLSQRVENANNSKRNYEALYQETTPNQEEIDKFKNDLAAAKEKVAQNQLNNINVKVPSKPKTLSVAERQAITAQLARESVKLAKLKHQMDLDFFGDQFTKDGKTSSSIISNQIEKKFTLTAFDKEGKRYNKQSLVGLAAIPRRTNLAIFYAMTQGISLDEITKPENTALRKQMGEKFINEMGTMTFDEFAKKNNLEKGLDDPETKKAYREYYLNHSAKIEKFMCKSYDALRAESIDFPDPNDYNDIIQKFGKFEFMGAFAQDLTQAVNIYPVERNAFDKNDPTSLDASQRLFAVCKYVNSEVGKFTNAHSPASHYLSFLASPAFASSGEYTNNINGINLASQGKAALQFFHDEINNNVDCLARLFDNDDLSKKSMLFTASSENLFGNKNLADSALNNFLCTNDPEMKTVVFDEKTNKVVFFGNDTPENNMLDSTPSINTFNKNITEGKKAYNKYFTYDNTMTFTDAYEDGVRAHPISEAEKAAKEAYYADIHAKIDESFKKQAAEEAMKKEQEEKLAAEKNRPLTEAEKAAQEKENYITGAMKDGISRENAELLWKTEQHDKKVAQEIDGVMKEADKIQIETRTRITRDELMGNPKPKMNMSTGKETKAPTKHMGMSHS